MDRNELREKVREVARHVNFDFYHDEVIDALEDHPDAENLSLDQVIEYVRDFAITGEL